MSRGESARAEGYGDARAAWHSSTRLAADADQENRLLAARTASTRASRSRESSQAGASSPW